MNRGALSKDGFSTPFAYRKENYIRMEIHMQHRFLNGFGYPHRVFYHPAVRKCEKLRPAEYTVMGQLLIPLDVLASLKIYTMEAMPKVTEMIVVV